MRVLNMRWYSASAETGKSKGFNLKEPKEELATATVQSVMGNLVTLKVIPATHAVDYAAVVDTQKDELFNLL